MSKKPIQLLDTAEELFSKHGIKRVTVEEICQKANVSKMTFYKNFSNKNGVVQALWNRWIDDGVRILDEIGAMDVSIAEKMQMILSYKLEMASKMSPEFINDILDFNFDISEFSKLVLKFIQESQARGEMRPEIKPEFIMAVFDKFHELSHNEELRSLYPSPSDYIAESFTFFSRGVMVDDKAEKG